MGRRRRVLVVRPQLVPYIQQDIDLLSKHFDVNVVDVFERGRTLKNSFFALSRLLRGVLRSDVTISWFADVHALWAVRLSRLLGRKSIVIVGGYELACLPQIGYGSMLNPTNAALVKKALRRANRVVAVSEFIRKEIIDKVGRSDVVLMYHGIGYPKEVDWSCKENLVVTVGRPERGTCVLKGLDTFVRASLQMPDSRFVIVGGHDSESLAALKSINPNVEFRGQLAHDDLMQLFETAKVYCQLSLRESFGISLAEAMSRGCIPVVTDVGAIPEVAGNVGTYVGYGDATGTAFAIKKALSSDNGGNAMSRIRDNFSVERREKELTGLIAQL